MKKNNLYRIIAIIILSLMFVFDILGILFIVRSCDDIKTAKADEQVVSFQSSRYFFTPTYDTSLSYTVDEDYQVFSGNTYNGFGYLSSTFYLDSNMDFVRLNMSYILSFKWQKFNDFKIPLIIYNNNSSYTVKSIPYVYNGGGTVDDLLNKKFNYYCLPSNSKFCLRGLVNGSTRYTTYSFYAGYVDGFNVANIVSVREEISGVYGYVQQLDYWSNGYGYSDLQSHDIYFYDDQGLFFKFSIIEVLSYQNYLEDPNARYMDRTDTIVLKNIFFSFNSSGAYEIGKQDGYLQGIQDKEVYGKIMFDQGYNRGNEAAKEVGEISFFNLIASVVDVPVKAFTSLFNINIFEVNLTAFFISILSLILVFKIIGIILGKL